jgi:hypothetical protein
MFGSSCSIFFAKQQLLFCPTLLSSLLLYFAYDGIVELQK